MNSYINNYEGNWENKSGKHLHISALNETTAKVSLFLGDALEPIIRPWFNNKPMIDMNAYYYPEAEPSIDVQLWVKDSGFCYNLLFETDIVVNGKSQIALIPSIIRNEADDFLEQYYDILAPLDNYIKT